MRIKTPITLCILTLFLITYQHVLSNTMKYAFITTYDNIESIEDDDEKQQQPGSAYPIQTETL